jgi:uncharacterized membrane protein
MEMQDNWSNDSANWKWGVFYYKKEDKRLFLPKRNKYLGLTINFANPYSMVFILAMIILIIVLMYY